ncbi:MAG: carbon-nitrogen hydrolase family protein [Chloroflexi bacterium]|nr:carbon-nitrogen hydrolase family protein [Chloroflexota bacterium]
MIPKRYAKYEKTVSLACVNFTAIWGNKAATLEKMKAITREAALQGNNIIVFPEIALTGHECDEEGVSNHKPCAMHRENAETVPGPSTEEMAKLARELDVYIIFGMPEQDRTDSRLRYIASAVIAPEGILGTYRKLHLGPKPISNESVCFVPGNSISVWETRYGPLGVQICKDFWFYPELSRIMALKGARLLINTTASPARPGKPYFLVQLTGARATENLVYTASANLVGKDRSMNFYGSSSICGPVFLPSAFGPRFDAVIATGSDHTEEIVSATLNFEKLHRWWHFLDWTEDRQAQLIADEFRELSPAVALEKKRPG